MNFSKCWKNVINDRREIIFSILIESRFLLPIIISTINTIYYIYWKFIKSYRLKKLRRRNEEISYLSLLHPLSYHTRFEITFRIYVINRNSRLYYQIWIIKATTIVHKIYQESWSTRRGPLWSVLETRALHKRDFKCEFN